MSAAMNTFSQPNLVIRASAGSGKTFQLTNRFLGLLHADIDASEILATTFTRKAAGEILDRVLSRLAQAAIDADKCAELAEFHDAPELTTDRCQELLTRVTRALHRLRVGTLDSFFAQIGSTHSLELGLPPGWTIVEEMVNERLRNQAIEIVLQSDSLSETTRLMNLLSKGQAERSVSELVRETVKKLYSLYQVTERTAWQQIPRHAPLSEAELDAAIQRVAQAPLPEGKKAIGAHESDLTLAQEGDWETLIKKGIAGKIVAGETTFNGKEIPVEMRAAYEALLQHPRALLLGQLANQTDATYDLLEKYDREYQRLKYEHRAMRFDDVTQRLRGVQQLGEVERLAFRMDGRVGHLLLDEFQDTSLAQWDVIEPFATQMVDSAQGTFFCVGDVKQAIYGWRGGVAEIFDQLETNLGTLDHDHLERSYRSAPPVIETVNRIFSGLTQHNNLENRSEPVARWCNQFQPHQTDKQDLPGYAVLETAPAKPEGENQTDVTLSYAADRIAQLHQAAPNRSIGVLVRKNDAVARLIYELRQRGIDASEEGGNPLTDSAAVQVLLSLLQLADHPGDTVARFHLAHSPLAPAIPMDLLSDTGPATLAARIRAELVDHGYGTTIRRWTEKLVPACSPREVSRLEQLAELAQQYEPSATLRASDFVAFVETQKVVDPASAVVRVMTVHQAKGLEFDTVVLPELEGGIGGHVDACVVGRETPTSPVQAVCMYRNQNIQSLLPQRLQRMFAAALAQDVAEELCVLYVSVTRPVHALHMIINPGPPKQKNLPKTLAGLLRAALFGLNPVPEQTVLYEHGSRDWMKQLGTDEPAPAPEPAAGETDLAPLQIQLPALTAGRRRGREAASPSGLEGGTTVRLGELFQPGRAPAARRGSLMHAWFERIGWLEEGRPERSTLEQIAARFDSSGLDLPKLLEEFTEMLGREAIQQLLTRSAYAQTENLPFTPAVRQLLTEGALELEVLREKPIATLQDGTLLTGYIDRLVLVRRSGELLAAEVIDFKTDGVPGGDKQALAKKVEHYRPQIDAYREAVAWMYRIEASHVAGRLAFVQSGQVVNMCMK